MAQRRWDGRFNVIFLVLARPACASLPYFEVLVTSETAGVLGVGKHGNPWSGMFCFLLVTGDLERAV